MEFAQSLEQRKDKADGREEKTLSARLARWAAELVLVFIGVYAAFWLNSYQQRQQEANRRDQILASLERTLREGIESSKINQHRQEEREAADLRMRWTPARCRRCIHSS